ncbi:MAG: PHB depolymerase family esterase [Burkholderiales bacterium]
MKTPFNGRAPSFDAQAINEIIRNALASAGLDTTAGPMRGVTETIRRALSSEGIPTSTRVIVPSENVVDVVARVVNIPKNDDVGPTRRPFQDGPKAPVGTFAAFEHANGAGVRGYKLYVPALVGVSPPPLLVMLHGCTQSADDFAAGTRMNRLADEHGFLVVYPEQASSANPSKCWNWFKSQDQVRDSGEPSLIAGIVRDVAARHGVDMSRIFVAGLSAGAAMAVILGETYPDLFAAVGAHSGLPYRSAHDIPSAMAAMKGGRSGIASLKRAQGANAAPRGKVAQAVPTIVFHGDRDHTVQHANGIEIVQQAKHAYAAAEPERSMTDSVERGTSPGGRSFSRTVHVDAAGRTRVESWTVHGAGHAWAGGSESGTYTDARGPDSSAEMVRFFLSLPRAGSA